MIRSFSGAKLCFIKNKLETFAQNKKCFSNVYIVAGSNDCAVLNTSTDSILQDATEVLKVASQIANKVFFSSIISRTDNGQAQLKSENTNLKIREMCARMPKVSYIDNDKNFRFADMSPNDAYLDMFGLHLNKQGTERLIKNLRVNAVFRNRQSKQLNQRQYQPTSLRQQINDVPNLANVSLRQQINYVPNQANVNPPILAPPNQRIQQQQTVYNQPAPYSGTYPGSAYQFRPHHQNNLLQFQGPSRYLKDPYNVHPPPMPFCSTCRSKHKLLYLWLTWTLKSNMWKGTILPTLALTFFSFCYPTLVISDRGESTNYTDHRDNEHSINSLNISLDNIAAKHTQTVNSESSDHHPTISVSPHSSSLNNNLHISNHHSGLSRSCNGLKCYHININSLLPKIDELRHILSTLDVHCLSVNETWLDPSISSNEINISNFSLFRNDRNRHGGGVALYISNTYKSSLLETQVKTESIWVSIKCKHKQFIVGSLYRPPSSNVTYYDDLISDIEYVYSISKDIILLGDLNYDVSKPEDFAKISDIELSFQLKQHIYSY